MLLYINNAFPTGFSHRRWHRRLNLHLCGASDVTRGSLALRRALAGGGRVPRPGDGGFWRLIRVGCMSYEVMQQLLFFLLFSGPRVGRRWLDPKRSPKDPPKIPKVSTGFPVSTGRNRSRRRALSHSESQRTADRRRIAVCVTEAVGLFDTKATSTMQKAPGPPTIEPNSCRRTPGEGRCHPSSLW